jgi:formylglycine-generating enzyme required for sulfatase activity
MHGNVMEWCLDGYDEDSAPLKVGSRGVYRGDCYYNFARLCQTANRAGNSPSYRNSGVSFRVALVPAR